MAVARSTHRAHCALLQALKGEQHLAALGSQPRSGHQFLRPQVRRETGDNRSVTEWEGGGWGWVEGAGGEEITDQRH